MRRHGKLQMGGGRMAHEKMRAAKNGWPGAILKKQQPPQAVSYEIGLEMEGKFPPDLTGLLGLGFERVSSSARSSLVRKIEGTDFFGNPYLFTEVEIRRTELRLRYSVPPDQDASLRHLRACTLMLRVLGMVPQAKLNAQDACETLLPALESGSQTCNTGYSVLSKKFTSLQKESAALRKENARLRRTCEEEAALSIEREGQISALSSRISKLEAVSDGALSELLLEWLSSHRGLFSAALFSRQTGVSPSRAEEGLEQLLKSGAIRQVEGRLVFQKTAKGQEFELQKTGVGRSLLSAISNLKFGAKKQSNPP